IGAGILAIVWGLLLSESKSAVPLRSSWKTALIVTAILSLVALLLDYCQYLVEYLSARYIGNRFSGKILDKGGNLMFGAKQLATFVSAAVLLGTASLIILVAIKTKARAKEVVHIWSGSVWKEATPNDKRESTLYLSDAN